MHIHTYMHTQKFRRKKLNSQQIKLHINYKYALKKKFRVPVPKSKLEIPGVERMERRR